jgi:hypothetical protein
MVGRLRVWFSSDCPARIPLSAVRRKAALAGIVLLGLLSLFCYAGSGERSKADASRIGGTFLQLFNPHQDWGAEDWRRLFDEFSAMQVSRIVVQWSVSEDLAFFASKSFRHGPNPPLETILGMADARGMKVQVGLWHDPGYWGNVAAPPQAVEVYLRRARLRATAIADELAPSMAGHNSFEGWYISEEIDDTNWVEPAKRKILKEHLESLSAALHLAAPKASVSLSCFSNARMDPASFETFWSSMLAGSSVDRLMFQDGIGAHKLELEYLGPYLSAIKRAATASERELSVIVEVFDQTGGPGLDGGVFKAVPAPLARIEKQITLAAEFAGPDIVAFSVPEYMTPAAGDASRNLLEGYLRKYVRKESPRAATQPAALP